MANTLSKIVALDNPAIPDSFGLANSPIGFFLAAWEQGILVRLTLLPAHVEKDIPQLLADYDLPNNLSRQDARAKALVTTNLFPGNNWQPQPTRDVWLGFFGTSFQHDAMEAILQIPFGKTISYGDLATKVGKPRAARAIGSVCAKNPIAFIVPCHRILAANSLGSYGYGNALKRQLLDWEQTLK